MNCAECPVLDHSLFSVFSQDQAARFSCIFHATHYRRNQILFFEGAPAEHVFSLASGLIKMVKPLENGKERITRVLFPGEIFGIEALAGTPRTLSAVVLTDSNVCSVTCEQFFAFLRSNVDITLEMVRFLVAEIARAGTEVTEMSFKDARAKLATFVLSLFAPHGFGGARPADGPLTLPLSSQEIGDALELSPETVSRAWKALRREGLIEKRGRQLKIRDLQGLQQAAHR